MPKGVIELLACWQSRFLLTSLHRNLKGNSSLFNVVHLAGKEF